MQCSDCFVRLGGSTGACPACFQRLGAIRNLYVEKVRDAHKAKQAAAIPTLSLQEQVLQLALAQREKSLSVMRAAELDRLAQREKSLSVMRAAAWIDEKKRARATADAEVEQRRVGHVQRKEAEANEKQRQDDDRRRQEQEKRQAAAVAVEEQRARTAAAAASEAEQHRARLLEWKEAEAQDYARRRQRSEQKREEMRQRKEEEANKKQRQEDARWRHQQVERRQAQLVALWETGSGLLAGLLVFIVAVPQTTIAVLVVLKNVTAGIACVALKVLTTAIWSVVGTVTFAIRPPCRHQRRWYEGVRWGRVAFFLGVIIILALVIVAPKGGGEISIKIIRDFVLVPLIIGWFFFSDELHE
jgi:hypothetical protein